MSSGGPTRSPVVGTTETELQQQVGAIQYYNTTLRRLLQPASLCEHLLQELCPQLGASQLRPVREGRTAKSGRDVSVGGARTVNTQRRW